MVALCAAFVCPAWAQTIPTLSCKSLTSQLNTGVTQPVPPATSGTPLSAGQLDPIWSLYQEFTTTPATPPSDALAWQQAKTPTPVSDPAWATFSDASWLSPGYQSVWGLWNQSYWGYWWPQPIPSATPYYNHYRVQFELAPEVPPSVVSLDMEYMGDDLVQSAYVNGTSQASFVPSAFNHGMHSVLASGWVAGLNTLVFSTFDTGWAAGFVAHAYQPEQSICSSSPIAVTKTADKAHYEPGETATYTVTVTSLGLVDASVTLADPTPAGLSNPTWSCAATGTAVCPSPAGPMPKTLSLPGQSSMTFTLAGVVTGQATLNNTATITPGAGGVCAATTGCSATVTPSYTPGSVPVASGPAPIPATSPWGLALLAAGVVWLARRLQRG